MRVHIHQDAIPDLDSMVEANVDQVSNYLEDYSKRGGRLPEEALAMVAREAKGFRSE